jgi:hypothetical protein
MSSINPFGELICVLNFFPLGQLRAVGQAIDRTRPCHKPRLCKTPKLQGTREPAPRIARGCSVVLSRYRLSPSDKRALCVPRPGCWPPNRAHTPVFSSTKGDALAEIRNAINEIFYPHPP